VATSAEAIRSDFVRQYERTFGISLTTDVEVVTVRAEIRRRLQDDANLLAVEATQAGSAERVERARVYGMRDQQWSEFRVISRASLALGERVPGPVLIVEGTTTIYVDSGYHASVDETGSVHLISAAEART
jgi:N-methylhydantoinase A/oxoprolinase/acetone carboxylase beta subunit